MMKKLLFRQRGATMMEVLVAMVVMLVGLVGLAALLIQSQRAEVESFQRAQALLLLQDMANRISANRSAASCYAFTTDTLAGAPYAGVGSNLNVQCGVSSVQAYTLANNDIAEWDSLLRGESVVDASNNNLGAMTGARGCVSYDDTTETYLISVSWQGKTLSALPSSGLNCAANLYGNERYRRTVGLTLQLGTLN